MTAYAKTLKDFFEIKKGETLRDFAQELKNLTAEDKEQLAAGIENETFDY